MTSARRRAPSGRFHHAERGRACGLFRGQIGVAAQVKMRRAVARTPPPRMTAEGNGFAFAVAAIRIAAVAALKLYKREMARLNLHASQLDRFSLFERRHRPMEIGRSGL